MESRPLEHSSSKMPDRVPTRKEAFRETDALLDPSFEVEGRYPHLDVTRFCCILVLFMESADPGIVMSNSMNVQEWARPLLWLLSGICFAKTDRHALAYLGRQLMFLSLGVSVNLVAWYLQGLPMHDKARQIVGKMIYLLVLIVSLALLAPLKHFVLRPMVEAKQRLPMSEEERNVYRSWRSQAYFVLVAGLIGLVILTEHLIGPALGRFYAGDAGQEMLTSLGTDVKGSAASLASGLATARGLEVCLGGLWILGCYVKLFNNHAMTAWAMLGYFYCHRLLFGWDASDLQVHCFYFVLVAMTAHFLGLARRSQLGAMARRYWMVVLFVGGILWQPGLVGDMTHQPPASGDWLRSRYVLTEAVLVLAWLTGGMYMADPKIFSEDGLGFVNDWILLVYLLHQAAFTLLGDQFTYGFLALLLPVCWFLRSSA